MYRSFCEQYRKEEMILSSLSERVVEIVDEEAERALSKRDARSSILSIFSRFSVLAVDIVQLLLHVDVNSLLIPSFASWEETRSGAIAFLEGELLSLVFFFRVCVCICVLFLLYLNSTTSDLFFSFFLIISNLSHPHPPSLFFFSD